MRLAVIADIHSNLHALESALEVIGQEQLDGVLCAGDIVGYGAFPNECCALVRNRCSASILGNHDRSALSRDIDRMNPYAAAAALWTADALTPDSKGFLSSLGESHRREVGGIRISMFHGSPSDPDEYVYEDIVDDRILRDGDGDIVIMAHTHVPYVWKDTNGLVVNPGSVGQPRDRDPRGSIAILDLSSLSCEIRRFEYPIDEAAEAILSAGLPHVLADRLRIGW